MFSHRHIAYTSSLTIKLCWNSVISASVFPSIKSETFGTRLVPGTCREHFRGSGSNGKRVFYCACTEVWVGSLHSVGYAGIDIELTVFFAKASCWWYSSCYQQYFVKCCLKMSLRKGRPSMGRFLIHSCFTCILSICGLK